MKPDPCFTFRYTYRPGEVDRRVRAADAVAACFAKWMWIGRDGEPAFLHKYIDKALLLNIARRLVPAEQANCDNVGWVSGSNRPGRPHDSALQSRRARAPDSCFP